MTRIIKKDELEKAINEIIQFVVENDIDPRSFSNDEKNRIKLFKEFLYDRKLEEIGHRLLIESNVGYMVELIVFDADMDRGIDQMELILEWEQYKKIPKTNLTYRYDSGDTNTKTQDHIHVFSKDNQLYAINRDGTPHDGSKAQLGKKEIRLLKSIGFNPPQNGLLEWINLDRKKEYTAWNLDILFS